MKVKLFLKVQKCSEDASHFRKLIGLKNNDDIFRLKAKKTNGESTTQMT